VLLRFKRLYRGMFRRMFAEWPDPMREPLVEYHLRSWRKTMEEQKNLTGELYD